MPHSTTTTGRSWTKASLIVITDSLAVYPAAHYEQGISLATASTLQKHPMSLNPRSGRLFSVRRFDHGEDRAFGDLRSGCRGELGDDAVERSGQRMLHFHGFER